MRGNGRGVSETFSLIFFKGYVRGASMCVRVCAYARALTRLCVRACVNVRARVCVCTCVRICVCDCFEFDCGECSVLNVSTDKIKRYKYKNKKVQCRKNSSIAKEQAKSRYSLNP